MSVWESLEALRNYVYRSPHADVLRRRQEWFDRMVEANVALWWVEAGTLPSLTGAQDRLVGAPRRGADAVCVHAEGALSAQTTGSNAMMPVR